MSGFNSVATTSHSHHGKPGTHICGMGCGVWVLLVILALVLVLIVAGVAIAALVSNGGYGAPQGFSWSLSFGATVFAVIAMLGVLAILGLVGLLLVIWCLFRLFVRAVFGPALGPVVASLRQLSSILRAIASHVLACAGSIDSAGQAIGNVKFDVPEIPKTDDMWSLLTLIVNVISNKPTAKVLSEDMKTKELSLFGPVAAPLDAAAKVLDSPNGFPPGIAQQLTSAADAIDAIANGLELIGA